MPLRVCNGSGEVKPPFSGEFSLDSASKWPYYRPIVTSALRFPRPLALLVSALACASCLWAGAADADLVRLLPPGAAAAGSINVSSLRGSEFFQNMRMMAEPQPGEGGELSEDDRMKQKAMEVFENIESLVSASYYEDPESPDDRET